MLSLREAKDRSKCRICEGTIHRVGGQPLGWMESFGVRCYPAPSITLNFGKEFAHTECLKPKKEKPDATPAR